MFPLKRKPPRKCSCPVCRTYLGVQNVSERIKFHCTECRAWFTFLPGVTKPTAQLDKNVPQVCKCAQCKDRDSR